MIKRELVRSTRIAFFIRLIDNFLPFRNSLVRISLVINNNLVLFSRTRFIKTLYILLGKLYLVIQTRSAPTNWRTLTIYLLTTTVIALTTLRTITAFFVNFKSINENVLLFKGLFINFLCFTDNEISGLLVFFGVQAVSTLTSWSAVAH